jgi:hypothetical protein
MRRSSLNDFASMTEANAHAKDLNTLLHASAQIPRVLRNGKHMKAFTFNTKETYLAYRAGWKSDYKVLSSEIRTLRHAYGNGQRRGSRPLTEIEESMIDKAKGILGIKDGASFWISTFLAAKQQRSRQAHEMLEELALAKLEAQRQYLAEKTPIATAVHD